MATIVDSSTSTLSADEPRQEETLMDSDTVLTPIRCHYLKKTLISLQFANELSGLTSSSPNPAVSPLSYLGLPFNPPPKDAPALDFPFMRFMFRQFVLTFPFLAAAPNDFFPQKFQPFISSILARNLSAASPFDEDAEQAEQATREKIISKIQKQFAMLFGAATKTIEPEEVVRLSQKDLQRLEALAHRRHTRAKGLKDTVDVNIIGVRTVVDKGRVRSRAHQEFLIRTRRSNIPDVVVSRRYGDFKTLADELRKAFPASFVPSPPPKDRSAVAAPVTLASPIASQSPSFHQDSTLTDAADGGITLDNPTPPSASVSAAFLAREKNRLTLRSYLNTLMSSSAFLNSPVLKSFLLSGPTRMTSAEVEDARQREEADQIREEARKRFAKELALKVDGLRDAMKSVKGDIMGKDGLRHVFAIIKMTSDAGDLPEDFKAVFEWGRISLASTIFHHYVAADTASESLASLKRIHNLMPYFVLRGILKISNPISMIRGVLDLFLAQPFGGRSLLQRMFTSSLAEEVKAIQEDIEAVRDKVEDPVLCEKIRLFVYAPLEIQAMFKADAVEEEFDIITIVLRSSEEPILSRAQLQRVRRAHHAHAEYLRQRESLADSDDDDGPQDDDAWLYEDLSILGKLYSRLRDRQQLMELIFEGTTAELLKDIITIFYAPLAQVYKAANIADSLGDLQNFISDLIKTVEQAEEVSQQDPATTVNMFVELVQRHEQAFYCFVHKVHSKGAGLFDSLIRWIELFLTVVREGVGEPVSIEYLLPHTGQERIDILHEVDAIALYHYRLKVAHESKVRKRFLRGNAAAVNGNATVNEDDAATQVLVDGVVSGFRFADLVQGEAEDLAAEDSESEDESETETESETESDTDAPESEEGQAAQVPPPQCATNIRVPVSTRLATEPTSGSSFELRSSSRHSDIPPIRQRSLSLSSRKAAKSPTTQKVAMEVIPPVPPLPSTMNTPLHGPPASHSVLRRRRTATDLARAFSPPRPGAPPPRTTTTTKRKKQGPDIKPPELKAIPGLLPLFIEMMRSSLRPRPI